MSCSWALVGACGTDKRMSQTEPGRKLAESRQGGCGGGLALRHEMVKAGKKVSLRTGSICRVTPFPR